MHYNYKYNYFCPQDNHDNLVYVTNCVMFIRYNSTPLMIIAEWTMSTLTFDDI